MTDLITSTLSAIMLPGMTAGDAARLIVDGINTDLGAAYTTNDLGKWRRATRAVPQPVQDWMLRSCIAHAIRQAGGIPPADDTAIDALARALCPPMRG